MLHLSRLGPPPPPPQGTKPKPGPVEVSWQASWVSGVSLAEDGIRVTRHMIADGWVSRLLGVLGGLAAAEGAAAAKLAVDEDEGA